MTTATGVSLDPAIGLDEAKKPLRLAGVLSQWRPYGSLLRATLWSKVGATTFGLVFFANTGLYLFLSGMLLYRTNMTFSVPISYPFLHGDPNPPGSYQPYLLFLPTDDFLLLVNLTGALVAIALGTLVGLNAALLVRHWPYMRGRRWGGGGFAVGVLPSLAPNLGCCTGIPVLLGLLPGSIFGLGVTLGRTSGRFWGKQVQNGAYGRSRLSTIW